MRNIPPLEDVDEASLFEISCTEDEMAEGFSPQVGDVEIKGTETLPLIDTVATINFMDMSTFHGLKTHPIVRPTKARIYPYGSTTPLALRGVIDATVKNGAEQIKMTFHVTEGNTGTLLACSASEALRLVSFA